MSIQKAVNMGDCLRKLRLVSETLEEYGDPESESLSMLIDDCIDYLMDLNSLISGREFKVNVNEG